MKRTSWSISSESALAEGVYKLQPETVAIIKYPHHEEEQLSPDFPQHLLPMYRFFRLVDGLSAGITGRNATVKLTVDGSKIDVEETNPRSPLQPEHQSRTVHGEDLSATLNSSSLRPAS